MRQPSKSVAQMRAQRIKPPKHPGSRAKREAAKRAGYFAVCFAVPEGVVSRFIGDNRGALPCFLISTSDERDQNSVIKKTNELQPYLRFRIIERAVVDTKEHMDRLKSAIDEMLMGHQEAQDNIPPLNKFRDILGAYDDKDTRGLRAFWGELLLDAQRVLAEGATHFDIYDDKEYERRIAASTKRGR
jgi:hypothetical protein